VSAARLGSEERPEAPLTFLAFLHVPLLTHILPTASSSFFSHTIALSAPKHPFFLSHTKQLANRAAPSPFFLLYPKPWPLK
jgi:hypothetical protein